MTHELQRLYWGIHKPTAVRPGDSTRTVLPDSCKCTQASFASSLEFSKVEQKTDSRTVCRVDSTSRRLSLVTSRHAGVGPARDAPGRSERQHHRGDHTTRTKTAPAPVIVSVIVFLTLFCRSNFLLRLQGGSAAVWMPKALKAFCRSYLLL